MSAYCGESKAASKNHRFCGKRFNGRQFVRGSDGQFQKDSSGRLTTRDLEADPDDTSVEMSPEQQAEFLRFMLEKLNYGTADKGGIRILALDNEPCLWHSTHRGMHPRGCSYDELWERTRTYAGRLKKIDPQAKIACGTFFGWTAYFYSGLDSQQVGQGQGSWDSPPDFTAHGKVPLTKWLLQQLKVHEEKTGEKLVDFLDFHFYPQTNIYMAGTPNDPTVMEARVQETRVMWDPTWKDLSWTGKETGKVIQLLRLMRRWRSLRPTTRRKGSATTSSRPARVRFSSRPAIWTCRVAGPCFLIGAQRHERGPRDKTPSRRPTAWRPGAGGRRGGRPSAG